MTETINGETVEFAELTLDDLESLESQIRSNQNDAVRKNLEECKIAGEARFLLLQKHKLEQVGIGHVYAYLDTSDGIKRALRRSLDKAGKSNETIGEILKKLNPLDASNLARALLGMEERIIAIGQEPKPGPLSETSGAVESSTTSS
jgi:hypothetical protein